MSSKAETILNNGQYKIERVLGRGEYGITYQAFDVRRQQVVAIKTVNPNLRHHTEFAEFQHHFKAVARRLAQCQHPNLVKVWEVFEDRGLPFMVMNYIPGQPLIESLTPGTKLPVTQAIEYINQIAEALTEVHQQGIIHCNLTPKVIVRHPQTNQVILTDFGIASRFTDGMSENGLTRIAQPYLGSRNLSGGYAALEQYLPHEQLTTATDIYSLAAILHYLLTGTAPLEAPLCLSHVTETLLSPSKPSLRELRPDLSPTLERVILWGLELEQQHRPQSLDQWLGFLPKLEDYALVASNSGKRSESDFERESSELLLESESGDRESEQIQTRRWSSIRGFVPFVFAMTAILSGMIGFYLTRVYGGVYSQTTVFQTEESFDQQFPDYDPSKPVFQHPSVESKLVTDSMSGSDERDFDYRSSDVLSGNESEPQMASEKAWIEDPNYVSSDWEVESSDDQIVESEPGSIDGYYSESEIPTTDSYSSDYSYSSDRYYSEYSSEGNYSSSYPSSSSEYSTPDYSNRSSSNSTPTRSSSNNYPAPATLDSPSYSSEYSPNPTDSSSYPSSVESNQYYSPSDSDRPDDEVNPSLETDFRPEFSPSSDGSQWENGSVPSRSSFDPYLETEIEYKFPGDSGSNPKFDAQSALPPSNSKTEWTASGSV